MSRKRPNDRYDENDLLGIKVSHSESLFKEGQDVILTLKDANVLDNDEDVLENVNLVDVEKTKRNLENKASKPDYNPFDEPEYDAFGRFKKKGLLSKYDEEINGIKKEAFRIGLDERRRLEQLEEIKKEISKERGEVSLDMPKYKIASEYYTEEEIVSFKKPKKQKKSKKVKKESEQITADSLAALASQNDFNDDDHGSRNTDLGNRSKKGRRVVEVEDDELIDPAFLEHESLIQNVIKKNVKKSAPEPSSNNSRHKESSSKESSSKESSSKESSKRVKSEKHVEIKKERKMSDDEFELEKNEDDDEDDFQIPDEEIYGMALEEDDLQRDLMKSLEKARKIKQRERTEVEANLVKISETVKILNEDEIKVESSRDLLFEEERDDRIINSTVEFCRNLGDLSTLKYGKEEEELLDFEKDLLEEREERAANMEIDDDDDERSFKSIRNKWNEVDFKTEQPKTSDLKESKPILEEEPDVSSGIAGALKLAMKKGYLDKEIKKSNVSVNVSSLQAKNYTIEEKFYDDDKFSRRERYNGALTEFREKPNYKPDVKLEYNDDNGRQLSGKEAFRVLSHKFHGKGSGKNKTDKRMRKIQQESKLKSMTSSDTPLNTTRLLQEKQKELHTPYVILSSSQNVLSKKT